MKCHICKCDLDPRFDVRYDVQHGPTLCSLACLWKHRGKAKIV